MATKTIKVKPNQTALDVALMACGTLEGAMQIMAANNVSITAVPQADTVYAVPDDVTTDVAAMDYLVRNEVEIGTNEATI